MLPVLMLSSTYNMYLLTCIIHLSNLYVYSMFEAMPDGDIGKGLQYMAGTLSPRATADLNDIFSTNTVNGKGEGEKAIDSGAILTSSSSTIQHDIESPSHSSGNGSSNNSAVMVMSPDVEDSYGVEDKDGDEEEEEEHTPAKRAKLFKDHTTTDSTVAISSSSNSDADGDEEVAMMEDGEEAD